MFKALQVTYALSAESYPFPAPQTSFWVGVSDEICLYDVLTHDSSHQVLLQYE